MRIGAQLYTLRDHLKTPEAMARSFEKLRAIGYRLVQIAGVGPIEPIHLRRLLHDAGLEARASHVSWAAVAESVEAVAAEQESLGCSYTAVSSIPESYRSESGYRQFAAELSTAARELAARGICLAYHNHSFEFQRFGKAAGYEILMDECTQDVAFELDTYWVQHGGGDVAQWISRAAGRAPIIHVKDMTMEGTQQRFAEVGEGNLNWPAILEAARGAGVECCIVEQDSCPGDPFLSLETSFRNLRNWGLDP